MWHSNPIQLECFIETHTDLTEPRENSFQEHVIHSDNIT